MRWIYVRSTLSCRSCINSTHSTPILHNFAFFSVDTLARATCSVREFRPCYMFVHTCPVLSLSWSLTIQSISHLLVVCFSFVWPFVTDIEVFCLLTMRAEMNYWLHHGSFALKLYFLVNIKELSTSISILFHFSWYKYWNFHFLVITFSWLCTRPGRKSF